MGKYPPFGVAYFGKLSNTRYVAFNPASGHTTKFNSIKNALLLFGLFLTLSGSAQIDSILKETLSEQEYVWLNAQLNKDMYDFDFTDKKVAFFNSAGGRVLRSKSHFFRDVNNPSEGYWRFDIVVFKESQKLQHGYDVAVIYGSKNIQPKVSNKLKRLVRKTTPGN